MFSTGFDRGRPQTQFIANPIDEQQVSQGRVTQYANMQNKGRAPAQPGPRAHTGTPGPGYGIIENPMAPSQALGDMLAEIVLSGAGGGGPYPVAQRTATPYIEPRDIGFGAGGPASEYDPRVHGPQGGRYDLIAPTLPGDAVNRHRRPSAGAVAYKWLEKEGLINPLTGDVWVGHPDYHHFGGPIRGGG